MRCRTPVAIIPLLMAVAGCLRPEPPPVPAAPPHRAPPATVWMAPPPAAPASAAASAGAMPSAPLDRATCVRAVLDANRAQRNAHSAFARAGLGVASAQSTVFAPRLTASYGIDDGPDNTGAGRAGIRSTAGGFDIEPYLRFGYNQDPAVPVPAGWGHHESAAGLAVTRRLLAISEHLRKRLPLSQAERAYWTAANDLALATRSLEDQAGKAFLEVQRAEARLALRRRSAGQTAGYLETISDQVAKGFRAPLEQLNAEISANQDQADLSEAQSADRGARESLNLLLARAVDAPVEIAAEDLAAAVAAVPEPPIEEDVRRVTSQHESLGSRRLEIDDAIEQIRIRRDLLAPQVTATAAVETVRSGDDLYTRADGRDGPADNRATLTLSWEMPLDGWRGERAQVAQAERRLQELQRQLDDDRAALDQRLRALHRRLGQLRTAAGLAEARVAAERARLAATDRRWQQGQVDNLELTRAKQSLDSAELRLLDTRVNLLQAWSEYRSLLPVRLAPPEAAAGGG